MRTPIFALLPLLAGAGVGTGCMIHEPFEEPAMAESAPPAQPPVVVANVRVAQRGAADARPQLGPSDADRPRPEPVFFHIGAGYGALGQVDLGPCRELGLTTGYLRMRVTFSGTGGVARATVESPAQPPPEALSCVGERLQLAMVPAFEGGDVTLSRSVFLESDTQGPAVIVDGEKLPPPPRRRGPLSASR